MCFPYLCTDDLFAMLCSNLRLVLFMSGDLHTLLVELAETYPGPVLPVL